MAGDRDRFGGGSQGVGRGALGSRAQTRSGRALVSLQLALSLPLLVGAGLLARTAYNVQRVDLGFTTGRLLLVRVELQTAAEDPVRRSTLRRALLDRIQKTSGVSTASFSQLGVFTGSFSSRSIEVEGNAATAGQEVESTFDAVGPGYFTTLGVRLLQGRDILDTDGVESPRVCVINEAFARRFFERRNPIGMRLTETDDERVRPTRLLVSRETREPTGCEATSSRESLMPPRSCHLRRQSHLYCSLAHRRAGRGRRTAGDSAGACRRADHVRAYC